MKSGKTGVILTSEFDCLIRHLNEMNHTTYILTGVQHELTYLRLQEQVQRNKIICTVTTQNKTHAPRILPQHAVRSFLTVLPTKRPSSI